MNVLQVNSSARAYADGQGSHSTRLANDLTRALVAKSPGSRVTVRDLARTPHPMVDEFALGALRTPAEQRTREQIARVALDDELLGEFRDADVIVLGAPMYNLNVSTQLKAWLDAITRAGVTFRYTPSGPVGLVTGKAVYVVTTRGGKHRDDPSDQLVPYLQALIGFLGIADLRFVYAEGLDMGPESQASAVDEARIRIKELVSGVEAI